MRERYYVRELVGIPILSRHRLGHSQEVASYYVLDRLVNCRVIATFDHRTVPTRRARWKFRALAERRAAELNEAWRQECAAA